VPEPPARTIPFIETPRKKQEKELTNYSQRDVFGKIFHLSFSTFPQNSKHTIIILHSNICLHNTDILVSVKGIILSKPPNYATKNNVLCKFIKKNHLWNYLI